MTVAELIERLRSYPQDAEVIIKNTDMYINGYYIATDIEDFEFHTVLISSDYEELLDVD